MRLIDADALLERMKETNRYFDVKFDIEEQPIAYDVEKVVAELEDMMPFCPTNSIDERTEQVLIDAIDIVRRGGI